MSQSSLVTKQWWANENNFTYGRSDTIHGIVIHHAASTSLDSIGQVFSNPYRSASAHYGVKGNQIHQYVREEDTAWHCGNWAGNCCTIGIEVTNSVGDPQWLVDEETFNTTVKLVADIAKRNGLGKIKFDPNGTYPTLSAHRDWSATYCPGDYLYSRMNEIAEKANAINYPNPKAELKWTKLDVVTQYECLDDPAHLVDFNHTHAENVKNVKEYAKGTIIDIYGKCENKTIGKTYLVTEYSYSKKITNGFRETHMKVYEPKQESENKNPIEDQKPTPTPTPAPEPEPEPVVETDTEPKEENKRGLSEEEYKNIIKNIKKVGTKAKKEKVMIPMSSNVYDILKIVAIVILPLVNALYTGLSSIWGFGFGSQIDQTIQLIIATINTLLGVALVKSSSDYHKGDAK